PSGGKLFLDATLGGGGHTSAILRAGAQVLGFDQDEAAIASATEKLIEYEDRFVAMPMNFRRFAEVLDESGVGGVDGILADLGVSSHQIDSAERGFSFQHDGPLDMRMNSQAGCTAADIVNGWSAEELRRIFQEYGEEPLARRAATAIVRRRAQRPFLRTLDLAETLASVMPRHGKTHPATRIFQALRIEVNDELGALRDLLAHAPRLLKPGGRIVIISFHSLEDRMVKQALQKCASEWIDRPEWPEARRNPDFSLRLLTKKPVSASPEETTRNPRSRSAHLRAAEKLA
ncbi:MAG: 16S rRNA (cytosine(1402)-N(4))-methyltransferase RsmH, partial [Verrucomicrobiaceae bacterium]